MAETFTHSLKVRFQHCDPAGIVFYPRYFEMINETVEVWFDERLGVAFEAMQRDLAGTVPTARIEIVFLAPSRHGDRLDFHLAPTRLGRSSLDLAIDAVSGADQRLRMTSTLVFVSTATLRPARWPAHLAAAIGRTLGCDDGARGP